MRGYDGETGSAELGSFLIDSVDKFFYTRHSTLCLTSLFRGCVRPINRLAAPAADCIV